MYGCERTQIERDIVYKELSYKVTGIAMDVFNKPGSGFHEKVYENDTMTLFRKSGINASMLISKPL